VSRAFRLALKARETLYRTGLLQTHRLNSPVVSIGNLTMGGTGKTPLAIFLAEQVMAEGLRPVILSRGYRRRTRGIVIVSRGRGPVVDWQDAGDEPWLMAQRLKQAAVVVGEDRYAAGKRAEEENLGDLFILDDGFQHRRLYRNFDIVTVDPEEWNAGEALLPAGRWREPKSAIGRANAVCVRESEEVREFADLPLPVFRVRLNIDGLFDRNNRRISLDEIREASIVAFAGIGNPERFFASLAMLGLRPAKCVSFRDHHVFSDNELKELGGDIRITTEKDAIRAGGRCDYLTLRVSATIPDSGRLLDAIRQTLRPGQFRKSET
jgi:tetraacyldisaccharide 4'-kinase